MTIFLSIIAFLIIFSLLILIHELGHFWMAKRAGVKVTEFGIGMPPRIWGKKVGDTEYTVNWIPFGGFVRMHGDDPKNENLITDPKSFVGKPLRQRIKIVVAGVLMNFLLAWFLLSIGFAVGMEPFIVTADDAVQAIDDGLIDLKHGVLVKEVEEESIAYEVGLEVGDIITAVNGQEVKTYDDLDTLFSEGTTEGFSIDVRKGSTLQNIKIDREVDESIGVEFERLVFLTRPMVQSVKIGSLSEQAGFRKGDLILSVNGKGIYSIADYLTVVRTNSKLSYTVLRSFNEREVIVDLGKTRFAHITDVGAASAAAIAGFEVGDIITEIDGAAIDSIDEIIELGEANAGSELSYTLHRNGNDIKVNATPNQHGKLGIGLSPILYHGDYDLDLSLQVVPASIMSMGEVSYPIYTAPFHALSESWRLTKFTASMFMNVINSVVQKFAVPEGVSGPVGIARMTHVFVQEGMVALLRFTALLSLSLAVINILPFPALDGGRLLFFIVEGVRGKRLNPKWESRIHAIGFILLMLLIAFISYTDIVGLFE